MSVKTSIQNRKNNVKNVFSNKGIGLVFKNIDIQIGQFISCSQNCDNKIGLEITANYLSRQFDLKLEELLHIKHIIMHLLEAQRDQVLPTVQGKPISFLCTQKTQLSFLKKCVNLNRGKSRQKKRKIQVLITLLN